MAPVSASVKSEIFLKELPGDGKTLINVGAPRLPGSVRLPYANQEPTIRTVGRCSFLIRSFLFRPSLIRSEQEAWNREPNPFVVGPHSAPPSNRPASAGSRGAHEHGGRSRQPLPARLFSTILCPRWPALRRRRWSPRWVLAEASTARARWPNENDVAPIVAAVSPIAARTPAPKTDLSCWKSKARP